MKDNLIEMPEIEVSLKLEEDLEVLNITKESQFEDQKSIIENYNIERNPKNKNYNKSLKIILLGDSMVGKSSIINRLCNDSFDENIVSTISLEYFNYFIKINDLTIRLQIWDTAGQEKYNSIVSRYYQNTDYTILV